MIDHTLISFLVKDGRVYERYPMGPEAEEEILEDLVTLAGGSAG